MWPRAITAMARSGSRSRDRSTCSRAARSDAARSEDHPKWASVAYVQARNARACASPGSCSSAARRCVRASRLESRRNRTYASVPFMSSAYASRSVVGVLTFRSWVPPTSCPSIPSAISTEISSSTAKRSSRGRVSRSDQISLPVRVSPRWTETRSWPPLARTPPWRTYRTPSASPSSPGSGRGPRKRKLDAIAATTTNGFRERIPMTASATESPTSAIPSSSPLDANGSTAIEGFRSPWSRSFAKVRQCGRAETPLPTAAPSIR